VARFYATITNATVRITDLALSVSPLELRVGEVRADIDCQVDAPRPHVLAFRFDGPDEVNIPEIHRCLNEVFGPHSTMYPKPDKSIWVIEPDGEEYMNRSPRAMPYDDILDATFTRFSRPTSP
jgi:hypothetical protein